MGSDLNGGRKRRLPRRSVTHWLWLFAIVLACSIAMTAAISHV